MAELADGRAAEAPSEKEQELNEVNDRWWLLNTGPSLAFAGLNLVSIAGAVTQSGTTIGVISLITALGTTALMFTVIMRAMGRIRHQEKALELFQEREAKMAAEVKNLQQVEKNQADAFWTKERELNTKRAENRALENRLTALRHESLSIAEPMVRLAQDLHGFNAQEAFPLPLDEAEMRMTWKKINGMARDTRRELLIGAIRLTVVCEGNLSHIQRWADPETLSDVVRHLLGRDLLPIGAGYGEKQVGPFLAYAMTALPDPIPFPGPRIAPPEDDS